MDEYLKKMTKTNEIYTLYLLLKKKFRKAMYKKFEWDFKTFQEHLYYDYPYQKHNEKMLDRYELFCMAVIIAQHRIKLLFSVAEWLKYDIDNGTDLFITSIRKKEKYERNSTAFFCLHKLLKDNRESFETAVCNHFKWNKKTYFFNFKLWAKPINEKTKTIERQIFELALSVIEDELIILTHLFNAMRFSEELPIFEPIHNRWDFQSNK